MSSSASPSKLASMTRPPLRKGQIWLPEGNPQSQEAREIEEVGSEEITFIMPNSGKKQMKKHETVSRFALWILREKAQEITVVFSNSASEILVED